MANQKKVPVKRQICPLQIRIVFKNLVISKLLPALETRLFDQPPSPGSNFENTMVKSKKAPFPKLTFSRGESNFSQYHRYIFCSILHLMQLLPLVFPMKVVF